MSAIWGIIDLNGNNINKNIIENFKRPFEECVIDRYEECIDKNVYMGCGIQYFVPEAVNEKLPMAEKNVFFTADVVLDNREELAQRLGIYDDKQNISDGDILYKMYVKYGRDCLNDLLGAYAFVYYDKAKNQVEMVIDAVGNRCVYYRIVDNIFYFSSLLEPLIDIGESTQLNDRWIVDFLAMDHLFMINETEETPIKDIYRLAPAQYIFYKDKCLQKDIYWKPFDNFIEYNYKNDEMYKHEFRQLWDTAVKSTIRDVSGTSILLSGGLDSTAVAAVAAPYLKGYEQQLYSYTSVPMEGYEYDNSGYDVENEKDDVEKTAKFYGNIKTNYIDLDGKNPWELAERAVNSMEMPMKSIQNYLWIEESLKRAYENKSRIMLTGSYGNTTISFTDSNVYMNTLYKKGKHLKLKRELELFSNNIGFSVKYALNQIKRDVKIPFEYSQYPYKQSYVKRDMAEKCDTTLRLQQLEKQTYDCSLDEECSRRIKVHWWAMRQIGEAFTKHSLSTGVLLRDPTIDKRVIEYCIRLPLEQFCKEGVDRRLVKEYLKDIMPLHVMDTNKKGKQSADLQYRIALNWNLIRDEWIQLYEKYKYSKYVECNYAKEQLRAQKDISDYTSFGLTRHMYTLMMLKYESDFNLKHNKTCSIDEISAESNTFPLISVIIPIYNTKEYLSKCIESVINQTYKNLEIILVDDGSTDGSEKVCDEYIKKDSRIIVIHKENGGISSARNVGMEVAKGEYIAFVDSDDWIEVQMYEKMQELYWENDADIVICGYRKINDNKIIDFSTGRIKLLYDTELLDTYLTAHDRCMMSQSPCNRLYRRDMIEDIRFDDIPKGEDGAFNAEVMPRAKKAIFIDSAYYNYITRANSLSKQKINITDAHAFIYMNNKQKKMVTNALSSKTQKTVLFNYFCTLLNMYCENPDNKAVKNLLKKEMHKISKEVRSSIALKENMGRKDKLQMYLATYTISGYLLSNKIRSRIKI